MTCFIRLYVWFQDDVLPKLMTSAGSYEDLFRKEIAKYDPICEDIAQNIEGQEQLLLQIQVYFFYSMLFGIDLLSLVENQDICFHLSSCS